MPQLYRRVPVHDTPTEKGRLPEKEGFYDTDLGRLCFGNKLSKSKWVRFKPSIDLLLTPSCWYEPVGDLPTEEEIEKEFSTHGHYDDLSNERQIGRQEGAIFIINKILNKK